MTDRGVRPEAVAAGLGPSSAPLNRGISEVGGSGRGPRRIALGVGALGIVALLSFVSRGNAPPTPSPRSEGREVAAERPAPPLDLTESAAGGSPGTETSEEPCFNPARRRDDEPAPPAPGTAMEDPLERDRMLELQRQALAQLEEQKEKRERRRHSSAVVFDEGRRRRGERRAGGAGEGTVPEGELPSVSMPVSTASVPTAAFLGTGGDRLGDERIAAPRGAQSSALEPLRAVRAQRIEHPDTLVPQGTLIRGVLETAIQSDLPGLVRARVTEPVYSFSGSLVVPRGATLLGEYRSGLVRGQTRVAVIWNRLLRPDGVSIELASPGTDALGRTGVGGQVDTHFGERFRSSLLLSLLGGAIEIGSAGAQNSPGSTIISTGAQDLQGSAEIALQNSINIPPTIEVARGTQIQVFVAKDLDFVETVQREAPVRRGE